MLRSLQPLFALVLLSPLSLLPAAAPKDGKLVKTNLPAVQQKPIEKKKERTLWSLQPVVRPAVPVGVGASANPIDAFIGDMLKSKGLTPVGPADKLTLLRRVYLDLIGLPPTPAEQDAFSRTSLLTLTKKSSTSFWRMSSTESGIRGIGWTSSATPMPMSGCMRPPAFTSGAIG